MEIKITRTTTAFVKINGDNIGYKTYFEIDDKEYFVETLSKDKKTIDQKIKKFVDKLK